MLQARADLACENIRFSSLFAALGRFSRRNVNLRVIKTHRVGSLWKYREKNKLLSNE